MPRARHRQLNRAAQPEMLLYSAKSPHRKRSHQRTLQMLKTEDADRSRTRLFEIHNTILRILKLIFVIKELILDLIYIKRDN